MSVPTFAERGAGCERVQVYEIEVSGILCRNQSVIGQLQNNEQSRKSGTALLLDDPKSISSAWEPLRHGLCFHAFKMSFAKIRHGIGNS